MGKLIRVGCSLIGPPIICKVNWYGKMCRLIVPQHMVVEMDLLGTEYVQLNILDDDSFRVKKVKYGIRKRRTRPQSQAGVD